MYLKNPYYLELMKDDNRTYDVLIKTNTDKLNSKVIKSLKYDLTINATDKLAIGGVYGASISLDLINFEQKLNNVSFDNKELEILIRLKSEQIYTVEKVDTIKVQTLDISKVKNLTSMWIPIGKFYVESISKKENKKCSLKLIDKTKFLEKTYIPTIGFPATFKEIVQDISIQTGIFLENYTSINENIAIEKFETKYSYKEILNYISECECGYFIVNRLGNLQLLRFNKNLTKTIDKYKEFKPAENYITVKKVKYGETVLGVEEGHTIELSNNNPFITESILQNIYNQIVDFKYMPYTLKLIRGDVAQDILDYITVKDTNNSNFNTYVFNNSWTFNGALQQNMSAKGENTLKNTYNTKGFINKTLERIEKELIPNTLEQAIENATELLTQFNGGYVVKKKGELYISDNEDLSKAVKIWRWNINGLGYSSTGVNGPYGIAITMDGSIVANYITSGSMTADRIRGGILKIGGINNVNGEIQVVDKQGNELVKINLEGITLSNGTKIIGADGLRNTYLSEGNGNVGFTWKIGEIEYGEKEKLLIDCYVPNNFKITKAIVKLIHSPVYWSITDINTGQLSYQWGYCQNVKLYKCTNMTGRLIAADYGGSVWHNDDNSTYNEIINAFGSSGFTAQNPSDQSHDATITNSIDIKDQLTTGVNRLKIETSNSIPNSRKACAAATGTIEAIVEIEGYIKY